MSDLVKQLEAEVASLRAQLVGYKLALSLYMKAYKETLEDGEYKEISNTEKDWHV